MRTYLSFALATVTTIMATAAMSDVELIFKPTNQNEVVTVKSDTAIFDQNEGVSRFLGNVLVTHSTITLTCDEAEVKTLETDSGDIEYIRVNNNVVMTNESNKVTSIWGLYSVPEGKIWMYEDVRITTPTFVLTGQEFEYDLVTGEGKMKENSAADIQTSE